MKFKIKKNILLDGLNNVSKALSSKNIIPILSGIKFNLTKENLILTASDNDITIEQIIEKNEDIIIEKTGTIVIKGKYILDIIRKLDAEFINIEIVDNNKILIFADNSEFNLNGIDSKEYPNIDLNLSEDYVNLDCNVFKNIINQTNYASSNDEARAVLTGVNIKINDKEFECSATDSYRLALRKINLDKKIKSPVDIIIPSKNLGELLKILSFEENNNIELYLFNNKIIFKFKNLLFQSRLINGTYPNTKNLIPEDQLFELRLQKREFYNMVDRASILNNDRDNNVITLELNNNLLKITSMSLEVGKVEEKLSLVNHDTDKIKISFSSKYMMDALRTINTEDIILTFVGEIKPILVKEDDNSDLINLILPIRTY